MLEVKELSFTYPDGSMALNKVSFNIKKGKKVFFHGSNGAGKSTLFQCINGLLKPKSGEIIIDGRHIKNKKERMLKTGIVFQNADDQIIAGSVFDEVAFGPINMGLETNEIKERVNNALKTMNIYDLKDKAPHFLSYGQKKRVTIASILSMNQDIIMMDEPTAGLDMKQTEELKNIFEYLSKSGITLLISTHDPEFSLQCADEIVVLEKGHVLATGNAKYILSNEDILESASLTKPIVLKIYEELLKKGLIADNDTVPRNVSQLIEFF